MTARSPEQMRALADRAEESATGYDTITNGWIDEAEAALRTAADSVEQWVRVAARLSDRIDEAPHDSFCVADLPSGKHECICWKADTLS